MLHRDQFHPNQLDPNLLNPNLLNPNLLNPNLLNPNLLDPNPLGVGRLHIPPPCTPFTGADDCDAAATADAAVEVEVEVEVADLAVAADDVSERAGYFGTGADAPAGGTAPVAMLLPEQAVGCDPDGAGPHDGRIASVAPWTPSSREELINGQPRRQESIIALFWAPSTTRLISELLSDPTVHGELRRLQAADQELAAYPLDIALRQVVLAAAWDDFYETRRLLSSKVWRQLRAQAQQPEAMPLYLLSTRAYVQIRSVLTATGAYGPLLRSVRPLRLGRPTWRPKRNRWPLPDVASLILGMFEFPGLYKLVAACPELDQPNDAGPKRHYPAVVLLGLGFCARYTRSHAVTAENVAEHGLYDKIRDRVLARCPELAVPIQPPTVDQITGFYRFVALGARDHVRGGRKKDAPALLWLLVLAFTPIAVAQAQRQGNLVPGTAPDLADPNLWQVIYGDGMFLRPYSSTQLRADYATKEQLHPDGTPLSERRARVQRWQTNAQADDKTSGGINFITAHTHAEHGRITMGLDWAEGAEAPPALDVLGRVAAAAAGGVHMAAWDMALKGRLLDELLSLHGCVVVNPNTASGQSTDDQDGAGEDDLDDDQLPDTEPAAKRRKVSLSDAQHELIWQHARRAAVDYADAAGRPAEGRQFEANVAQLQRRLANDVRFGRTLPLGLSMYPTSKGGCKVVHSAHARYGELAHEVADGQGGTRRCRHELHVDDGALWEVLPNPDDDLPVKTRLVRCVSAVPQISPAHGGYALHSLWQVDCPHEPLLEAIVWDPTRGRVWRGSGREPDQHKAIRQLRVLNRALPQLYWLIAGRRQAAESSHNQLQRQSLPIYKRATSLDPDQQLLDCLGFAMAVNAVTWNRFATDTGDD